MNSDALLFTRSNPYSWRYYFKATEDYALSRCGLMNGMFSGFELGAQTLEKYLKSLLWVQFHKDGHGIGEKTTNIIRDECKRLNIERNGQHDLLCFANLALQYGFNIDSKSVDIIIRFNEYYSLRYPDEGKLINILSGDEVNSLDYCVYNIWDNFKNINKFIYYWCGPNSAAVGMAMKRFAKGEQYILLRNKEFLLRSVEICGWISREMARKSAQISSPSLDNVAPT